MKKNLLTILTLALCSGCLTNKRPHQISADTVLTNRYNNPSCPNWPFFCADCTPDGCLYERKP